MIDNYNSDAKIGFNNFGLGMQLGAQWLINDKVSIDWYFLGLGIVRNNVSIRYESDDPNINFQDELGDIEQDWIETPIIGDKLDLEFGEDYGKVSSKFWFPSVKGGLSIGYAF